MSELAMRYEKLTQSRYVPTAASGVERSGDAGATGSAGPGLPDCGEHAVNALTNAAEQRIATSVLTMTYVRRDPIAA
ncbi:MAG: hypothetical protein Kow0067_06870 [Coriobacteriia bacterium]